MPPSRCQQPRQLPGVAVDDVQFTAFTEGKIRACFTEDDGRGQKRIPVGKDDFLTIADRFVKVRVCHFDSIPWFLRLLGSVDKCVGRPLINSSNDDIFPYPSASRLITD